MFLIYLQAMKKIIFINFQEFQIFFLIVSLMFKVSAEKGTQLIKYSYYTGSILFIPDLTVEEVLSRVQNFLLFRISNIENFFISQRIPLRMSFWEYFELLYDYS